MQEIQAGTLVAATLTTGLSAGLYYGFACAVMPGLARSADRTFVETMQRINTAIINGWFMLLFLGSLVLTAAAAALQFAGGGGTGAAWTVAALVLYSAVLVITMRFNVPLNNRLDAGGRPEDDAGLAALRAEFERSWVRWNTVRAAVNAAAFGCLAWALVLQG
ncbi:hypothetical protein AN219_24660 [Streptomyces nanshensis]|nr:hypothetical protein AN219_24660 [Streptomyces nanshensis]